MNHPVLRDQKLDERENDESVEDDNPGCSRIRLLFRFQIKPVLRHDGGDGNQPEQQHADIRPKAPTLPAVSREESTPVIVVFPEKPWKELHHRQSAKKRLWETTTAWCGAKDNF